MASSQRFSFTDEEMLEELRKMGYDEVSPDVFQMMKDDIMKLAEQVESNLELESSSNINIPNSPLPQTRITVSPAGNDNSRKSHRVATIIDHQEFNPNSFTKNRRQNHGRSFTRDNGNREIHRSPSNDGASPDSDAFLSFNSLNANNAGEDMISDNSTDYDTAFPKAVGCKTIKRKVMRHRNGQAVITEQLMPINIPEIPHEANNGQSNESLCSEELSFQSSGSSGSSKHLDRNPFPSNRSTSSLSSTKSAPPRFVIPKRKKSDPVAMYNYYRKFWDNFKPPGEKTHDKLRWTIRDKMLDYNI